MIKIRKANKKEAANLSSLVWRSKAYWGYSVEFMEACRKELLVTEEMIEHATNYFAIAEEQGMTVGFYALCDLSESNVELDRLFVEPKHIGTDIGRILFNHAKNHAAANGGAHCIFMATRMLRLFIRQWVQRIPANKNLLLSRGAFFRHFQFH